MVIAAHPDDEVFGCGGTLIKHAMKGDDIHIVTLTDGVSSRGSSAGQDERSQGLERVAHDLKATFSTYKFKDNQLDSYPLLDITKIIEGEISEFLPNIIYTHHLGDLNVDHQICHKSVLTACRPQPNFSVNEIYTFEINSSTEWNTPTSANCFLPNMYVDISDVITVKERLILYYRQELREYPHVRSLKGIQIKNELRGMEVGLKYAEAFGIVRIIK